MGQVRILYNKDKTVSIIYPCKKSKLTEQECLNKATPLNTIYEDVDISEIPKDRSKRYAWRGEKGKGIFIDDNVKIPKKVKKEITLEERIEILEDKLNDDTDNK
uniref:Uncharacterized protein n=1 Tax=viral metagenome TaxID=1070528 RepID=A0A6M3IFW8_9ZZZZ